MADWVAQINDWLTGVLERSATAFSSPNFYNQLAVVAVALVVSMLLVAALRTLIPSFRSAPANGPLRPVWQSLHQARALALPILALIMLSIGIGISDSLFGESWLIRIAGGLMAIVFFYSLISRVVHNRIAKILLAWIGIPIATLQVFGWLLPLAELLDSKAFESGNIRISLLGLLRTLVFGALLFWLGSISNAAGKNVIRARESWNPSTRELAAKFFEIALFLIIFLVMLQIMGIRLTTLAVFGGAVGIGLGFGLQQIASNFISGIIILLDRSITPGDFVELEDGRSGWLRELTMRYGILETYDGKDIMVPNEAFITSSYTNWTHKDKRQRYSLHLQVAYSTDLDLLFENIRQICRDHPKVLSDPGLPAEFQPDAEIEAFGESGIDILVEFWMNGIDDGENRVGADLMHSIWRMIKANGMEIPFPQREIRFLGAAPGTRDPGKS